MLRCHVCSIPPTSYATALPWLGSLRSGGRAKLNGFASNAVDVTEITSKRLQCRATNSNSFKCIHCNIALRIHCRFSQSYTKMNCQRD